MKVELYIFWPNSPPCRMMPTSWSIEAAKSVFCLELSYRSELMGTCRGRYRVEMHNVPKFSVAMSCIVTSDCSMDVCKWLGSWSLLLFK